MASISKQGKVQGVFSNPFEKAGKTIYLNSFRIDGDPIYYRVGEKSLGMIKQGQVIKFETEQKGNNWQVNPDTISILENIQTPPSKPFGGKSSDEKDYWSRKEARDMVTQERIQYQSARNAAIEMARLLFEAEAIPNKDSSNKPFKTGAKFDILVALVEELTVRFHNEALNVKDSLVKSVKKEEAIEENNKDDEDGFGS